MLEGSDDTVYIPSFLQKPKRLAEGQLANNIKSIYLNLVLGNQSIPGSTYSTVARPQYRTLSFDRQTHLTF
jgi:hypothetical protein